MNMNSVATIGKKTLALAAPAMLSTIPNSPSIIISTNDWSLDGDPFDLIEREKRIAQTTRTAVTTQLVKSELVIVRPKKCPMGSALIEILSDAIREFILTDSCVPVNEFVRSTG